MNTELYIAKQILPHKDTANISKPIVNIAIIAIALGLAVMMIAISVIVGFKSTISEQIFGFSSHIEIVNFDTNNSFESLPITTDQAIIENIKKEDAVVHIQTYATKPALVKVNGTARGIVVKGIDSTYNWDFIEKHLVEGKRIEFPTDTTTDNVVISKTLANLLQLSIGDKFITSFVPNDSHKKVRKRSFFVTGIYETHLNEIDDRFILIDMRHIQNLNNWESNQCTGYEVFLKNYKNLDFHKETIQGIIGFDITPDAQKLRVQTLKETTPQIFDWLSLLDMNAWLIIALMILVAGMNMITGLLVIILEKTTMIGVLKALGTADFSIRKIFIFVGSLLITKGLFWGNIIGLGLCLIQYYFHIFTLDPTIYFMSFVPIKFKFLYIILLNVGTFVLTSAMLILPSILVTKISPAEAIRFD
ncbi:MAG: ABC transporter permease [Bacteroidales bacterium]|nr:ABC transporter permease [Bacteroidales bacterium]